jgi:hypothetical protein
MRITHYVQVFLYTRIISAFKRVEFASDEKSCIIRRRCLCDIALTVTAHGSVVG